MADFENEIRLEFMFLKLVLKALGETTRFDERKQLKSYICGSAERVIFYIEKSDSTDEKDIEYLENWKENHSMDDYSQVLDLLVSIEKAMGLNGG